MTTPRGGSTITGVDNSQTGYTTIDEYIALSREDVKPILSRIREVVRRAVPEAEELISYRMPAFRLKRIFFYFAAFRNHIGVYPPVEANELLEELTAYRGPKGNLKFPLDGEMPYELIGRIAAAQARDKG